MREKIAVCIGCGCDDLYACWDDTAGTPCHWLVTDRSAGLGVCSCCPEHLERWQQGDRTIAVPVELPFVKSAESIVNTQGEGQ